MKHLQATYARSTNKIAQMSCFAVPTKCVHTKKPMLSYYTNPKSKLLSNPLYH